MRAFVLTLWKQSHVRVSTHLQALGVATSAPDSLTRGIFLSGCEVRPSCLSKQVLEPSSVHQHQPQRSPHSYMHTAFSDMPLCSQRVSLIMNRFAQVVCHGRQ